jgi:hypothetical protein
MMNDTTKLSVEWDNMLQLWSFSAHRDNMTWSWTITPGEFKRMISTLSDMDDEFDQRLGASVRQSINKKDEL